MRKRISVISTAAVFCIIVVVFSAYAAGVSLQNATSLFGFSREKPVYVEAAETNGSLVAQVKGQSGVTTDGDGNVEPKPENKPKEQVGSKETPETEAVRKLSDAEIEAIEAIRLETLQVQAEERQYRRQRIQLANEAPLGESLYSLTPLSMRGAEIHAAVPEQAAPETPPTPAIPASINQVLQQLAAPQPSIVPAQPALGVQPVSLPREATVPQATPTPVRAIQPAGTQSLERGTFISATMLTELRSELPGVVRAMVTDAVYDTHTGRYEMIPAGSMLIGKYNSQTAPGQSRLLVAWDEIQFPDGRIVALNNQGAVDKRGASGLTGKRQTGFLTTILTGALVNLAANGGRNQNSGNDLSSLAGQALGQSVSNVTQEYMASRLSQGPKFTIKAGEIVNVLLDQPLYLKGRRIY